MVLDILQFLFLFLFVSIALLFGCYGVGKRVLAFLGFIHYSNDIGFAWGSGIALLVLILTMAGILNAYYGFVFYFIAACLFGIGLLFVVQNYNDILHEIFVDDEDHSTYIVKILLLFFALFFLGSVLSPETRHDPYDYHLAIPNQYLAHHSIVEMPWHVFTYMPKNGEMLYAFALSLGGDWIAKYIHYIFGGFCALLVGSFITQLTTKKLGYLGAFFVVSVPVFGFVVASAYIDLIRSFWELLALYLLFFVWKHKRSTIGQRILMASTFFAGMAIGTKYTSWLLFCVPYIGLVLFTIFYCFPKRFSKLLPFLFVCGLVPVLAWLSFNTIWTGNPIYPLAPQLFGQHIPAAEAAYQFFLGHAPTAENHQLPNFLFYIIERLQILLLNGNALVGFGLFALLLSALWRKSSIGKSLPLYVHNGVVLFVFFSFLFFFWGSNNEDGRFALTSIFLLAIPLTLGLFGLQENIPEKSALKKLVIPTFIFLLFINGIWYRVITVNDMGEAFLPKITAMQKADYLTEHIQNYPIYLWANENLSENAKVFGLGYPLRRKLIYSIKYGYYPFLENMKENPSVHNVFARLVEAGITHVAEPFPQSHYNIDWEAMKENYLLPLYEFRQTTIYQLAESK